MSEPEPDPEEELGLSADPESDLDADNPLDLDPDPDADTEEGDVDEGLVSDPASEGVDEERDAAAGDIETDIDSGIFAVKTTASQETTVADMLVDRDNPGILSVLVPSDVTAYILVEAEDDGAVERAIERIPHAHTMVEGQTSMQEVEHFLTPKPSVSGVNEGDMVEIISGPFKGEKARIKRIDEASEEVTVELHESTVPIPVTVRGDHIRVLDSEER